MSSIYRELSSHDKYIFNKCVDYYNNVDYVENSIKNKRNSKRGKILNKLVKEYKQQQHLLKACRGF